MTDSSSSGPGPQSNHGGSVDLDPTGVTQPGPGSAGPGSAGPGPGPAGPAVALPAGVRQAHEVAVATIQGAYAAVPAGTKVRLAKRTSNLFRFRDQSAEARAA